MGSFRCNCTSAGSSSPRTGPTTTPIYRSLLPALHDAHTFWHRWLMACLHVRIIARSLMMGSSISMPTEKPAPSWWRRFWPICTPRTRRMALRPPTRSGELSERGMKRDCRRVLAGEMPPQSILGRRGWGNSVMSMLWFGDKWDSLIHGNANLIHPDLMGDNVCILEMSIPIMRALFGFDDARIVCDVAYGALCINIGTVTMNALADFAHAFPLEEASVTSIELLYISCAFDMDIALSRWPSAVSACIAVLEEIGQALAYLVPNAECATPRLSSVAIASVVTCSPEEWTQARPEEQTAYRGGSPRRSCGLSAANGSVTRLYLDALRAQERW